MIKFSKFFEVAYLCLAAFFVFESYRLWDTERTQSYIFIAFSVLAVFMFFFRRHFRHKYTNERKDQE